MSNLLFSISISSQRGALSHRQNKQYLIDIWAVSHQLLTTFTNSNIFNLQNGSYHQGM